MNSDNKNNLIGLGIKALGTIFTGVAERIRARRLRREENSICTPCSHCATLLPPGVRYCWGCGEERMEAANEDPMGETRTIDLSTCPGCDGLGSTPDEDLRHRCPVCRGTGRLKPTEMVKCPGCDGEGSYFEHLTASRVPCVVCKGDGKVART